ncbi:hypothetical protein ACNS7O_19025 (plasmid) [Haloferacaceae archaeon DSL9]
MATTVEQCRHLDVNWCNSEGVLKPGHSGTITWSSEHGENNGISYIFRSLGENDVLELRYSRYNRYLDDEPRNVTCTIPIDYTECNFGGERPWFRCPQCHDRVGKLYSTPRSDHYVCRDCGNLIYQSQEHTSELVSALRAERTAIERRAEDPFDRDRLRDVYDAHKRSRKAVATYTEELGGEYESDATSSLRDVLISPQQMPSFEEWAEQLFHRVFGNPDGRAYGHHGRCTATAKTTGERCRQPARGDHGKCYYHGGAKGSGIGEGQTDHAAEAIREALEQNDTLSARFAIFEKSHVR